MLALRPANVAEAVQAADEFITVGGGERPNKSLIMNVEDEGMHSECSKGIASLTEAVQAQTALLTQLVLRTAGMGVASSQTAGMGATSSHGNSKPARKLTCYQCGGPHLKRQCPQVLMQSGNGQGPAQQ